MTRERERGSVTVFVTIMTVTLIFVAGLVVDGGQILNARRQATNLAESAARAGAQEIDETSARLDGVAVINPTRATRRATEFLAASGHDGSVTATRSTVTVTVQVTQPLLILGIGGMGSVDATGVGTATPLRGISEAEQ